MKGCSRFNLFSLVTFILSLYNIVLAQRNDLSPSLNFTVCEGGCPYARLNAYGGLSASLIKLQYSMGPAAGYQGTWTIKGTLHAVATFDVLAMTTSTGLALGITQWNGTLVNGLVYQSRQCVTRSKRTVECNHPKNRVTLTETGSRGKLFDNKKYRLQATMRSNPLLIPAEDQTPLRIVLGVSDVLYTDRSSMQCTLKGQKTVTMTCCS